MCIYSIYNGILAVIKCEIMSFAPTQMAYGLKDYHSKWRKSDREGQICYGITYMWNL